MRSVFLFIVLVASSASAQPATNRPGANHHLGDDSFVARYGRTPTPDVREQLRMRVHLEYVRDRLAARPATRSELAGRRTELLAYLADYIAKGTTPRNTYVTWRNPVFIDAAGNICAVGYLIERSAGRALAETIAAQHRLDYLEDIAAAMPEVADWIETSGFTLDELASIQPGYEGPSVQHAHPWGPKELETHPDGTHDEHDDATRLLGAFKKKQMTGPWRRTSDDGKVLGLGTFTNGNGAWKSYRPDGTRMAEGRYVRSRPEGEWRFYYPSGRLAATGTLRGGVRSGTWTFYYDTKASTVLATGGFVGGQAQGTWKHYGPDGKLVATAAGTPWDQLNLSIEPGVDGVRHEVDQGQPASRARLDGFYAGKDRLYVKNNRAMYDADGNHVSYFDGAWSLRSCSWSAKQKTAARAGDIVTLHKLIGRHEADGDDKCTGAPSPLPPAKLKRYTAMLASRATVHAPIPALSFGPVDTERVHRRAHEPPEIAEGDAAAALIGDDNVNDMATYVTDSMTWYMEWPYVDMMFVAVYSSLPGFSSVSSEY